MPDSVKARTDGITYEKYKSKFTYINEFYNVDNFYTSFLLTFRCTTGENWPNIMMELAFVDEEKVSEAYAYIYMIISNFINSIIMLNLFLMVTLQQYDEFTGKNYNPIEKFEGFLAEFNNSWNKFSTPEDKGIRIKQASVIHFFMDFVKNIFFETYFFLNDIIFSISRTHCQSSFTCIFSCPSILKLKKDCFSYWIKYVLDKPGSISFISWKIFGSEYELYSLIQII